MKAVVFEKYGPPEVLRLVDVPRPEPKDDEILVRIHATTVNRTDTGFRGAEYFVARAFTGLLRPKKGIHGNEFAGEVEAVGATVTAFKPGDRVFGIRHGAHAEYVCVPEGRIVAHMPAAMTFEEAAAVADGALTALSALKSVDLGPGRSILIYGASGSIGTASVQLAKHFGAHVTAVCNTENVDVVRSLGADEVIDYLREDFTKSGKTYDVVFDAVGKTSFRRCRSLVKPGGVYLDTDPGFMWHLAALTLLTRWLGNKRARLLVARLTKENLLLLKELLEAGKYRAVIDRRYPLEEVVEASRYVETGQKTGNVVLAVGNAPDR